MPLDTYEGVVFCDYILIVGFLRKCLASNLGTLQVLKEGWALGNQYPLHWFLDGNM